MASHRLLLVPTYSLLLTALLAMASSSETTTDIVAEIRRALDGREDLRTVRRYLGWATELHSDFPVKTDADFAGYTFFAPTNFAIVSVLPADASDPFYDDGIFRHKVLVRHFARQRVTQDDLKTLTTLTMADSTVANVTRQEDTTLINGAIIKSEVIPLANNLGMVYIINKVFTNVTEVQDVMSQISKKPSAPSLI